DGVAAQAVEELVAQTQPRSRQPLTNRSVTQVQKRRHLRDRLALAIEERHDLARFLRQEVDGLGDRAAAFFGDQLLPRIGPWIHDGFEQFAGLVLLNPAASPPRRPNDMMR